VHTSNLVSAFSIHKRGVRLPLGMPLKLKRRTNSSAPYSSRSMCLRIPHISPLRIDIVWTNQPLSPLGAPHFGPSCWILSETSPAASAYSCKPSPLFLRIGMNDGGGRHSFNGVVKAWFWRSVGMAANKSPKDLGP